MIDPDTKAVLLRVAIVANFMFGVFSFKAAVCHGVLTRFLDVLAAARRFIIVGFVTRSDPTGVYGDFHPCVLWGFTAALAIWFVVSFKSFVVVFGSPLLIMTSSVFLWKLWTSIWAIPINILVTCIVFWFGLIFGIWFWFFTAAIVFKAFSWLAEVVRARFSQRVFDVLTLLLLVISTVLTLILI